MKTLNVEARKMALTIARRYTSGTMFSCPDDAEVCNMFEKVRLIYVQNGENMFETVKSSKCSKRCIQQKHV
jgi:hypothetical protein